MSALKFVSMRTAPPDTHKLGARIEIAGEELGSAKSVISSMNSSRARPGEVRLVRDLKASGDHQSDNYPIVAQFLSETDIPS